MRSSPPDPQLMAETRGRLATMMVVREQLSLDRGSWLLAQELMWEEDPPYSAFGSRGPDQSRRPGPRAANPLWIEVAIQAVKDLDDWTEKRRRIGRAQGSTEEAAGHQEHSGDAPPVQEGQRDQRGRGRARARRGR